MGDLADAVRRDLETWQVIGTSEAALALLLAQRIEDPGRAATVAPDAGRLLEVLAACRALQPSDEGNPLDDIRARRDAAKDRRSAAADRKDPAR